MGQKSFEMISGSFIRILKRLEGPALPGVKMENIQKPNFFLLNFQDPLLILQK